jgi:hypothetical protein
MRRDLRLSLVLLAGTALACSAGNGANNGSQLTITACATNPPDGGVATLCPAPNVPADGVSTITLTFHGIAADGSSPYSGIVDVTSRAAVLFGDGKVQNDLVVMNGSATLTVACAPGTNCVGQVVIGATLTSNGANATAAATVTFTGPTAPTGSGTTGGTGGTGSSGAGGGNGSSGAGATGTTTGAPPVPAGIKALTPQHPYMGIDYQTGTLTANFPVNTFFFEVDDNTGTNPVPGATVTFAPGASNAQGSFIVPIDGGFTAMTDAKGHVSVQGHSGQKTGPFTVTATVENTDFSVDATSSVVGTQPSLSNSTLTCSPLNLPVYIGNNPPCETTSPVQQQTVCTLNLADRFNYVVQVPIAVQFFTEAGNFTSPTVQTPAFGSATGVPGQCTNTLLTNSKLPLDVEPLFSEPSYVGPCASDPARTYNPRDGLVTIIAVFQGEEAFSSQNGSGIYRLGDTFTDVPQPFVDSNDNSIFDPNEFCAGISDGGICLGPDGIWDANASVFVETRVLYSGSAGQKTIVFSNPAESDDFVLAEGATKDGTITWADMNLNQPAGATVYAVVKGSGPGGFTVTFPAAGNPGTGTDYRGMQYTTVTTCDGGFVPDDGGTPVATDICLRNTSVGGFSGGFTTQYQMSNTNTQPASGEDFEITASMNILNNTANAALDGHAN